ncbi:divergent PAP2 family protein [Candidatus Peregrinibacteria bacterium]|nr:divergent PAP2 family protein [Candidatus Peregrinibacteria bacterium]
MLLHEYLRAYLFLIPLFVLVLSELVKIAVEGIRTGNWHERLFRSGGMPSSHSAFVTSLLMIVEHKRGIESVEFAIAFCFAAIVWYDAMGVRREVGRQAELLNRLQKWQKLSVNLGHSFLEVLGGIVFGAAVTLVGIWLS